MSRLAEPATLCFVASLLSRLLSSSTPSATFQVLWKCRSHPSRNDALVVKRTSRPARTGTHGIPETGCGGPRGRPDPVFRRARFVRTTHPKAALARLAPHRRPLAYREEEGGPPLGRPYPFGFLFGLTARGESTPHEPQDVPRAESGGLCACGALSPRVGGANRCAIHSTVFRGEGKPLPTPHPRGAARREGPPSEFHHRLLSLRETRGGFESTMNPAWFDGLHMPLETPGCEALEAACDDGACRGR